MYRSLTEFLLSVRLGSFSPWEYELTTHCFFWPPRNGAPHFAQNAGLNVLPKYRLHAGHRQLNNVKPKATTTNTMAGGIHNSGAIPKSADVGASAVTSKANITAADIIEATICFRRLLMN